MRPLTLPILRCRLRAPIRAFLKIVSDEGKFKKEHRLVKRDITVAPDHISQPKHVGEPCA